MGESNGFSPYYGNSHRTSGTAIPVAAAASPAAKSAAPATFVAMAVIMTVEAAMPLVIVPLNCPRVEAHMLLSWNKWVIVPSETRGKNPNRGEEPTSTYSYLFLADEVKCSLDIGCEKDIAGCDLD